MPSEMPVSPLSFSKDAYFSSGLSYSQTNGSASFLTSNERGSSKSRDQYSRNMLPASCSRTLSYDNSMHQNGSPDSDMHVSADGNTYYSSAGVNGVADLPALYDAVGNQYPRDCFNQTSYTLPNTPLEAPSFPHTAMQTFDMSRMAQKPGFGMPDYQNGWDSRWKSLFDAPKSQDPHSLSPSASQPRQTLQSDSGLLAANFEASRRQSTDTGSTSTKSVKSGNNPVSTVLAHSVYSVLNGEQAWSVIKQLQQTEIVQDVWSEVAKLAHPDKAPDTLDSTLWEQIVSGKVPLNLHELSSGDLVLVFSGLAILAKRAAALQHDPSKSAEAADSLNIFIESHAEH